MAFTNSMAMAWGMAYDIDNYFVEIHFLHRSAANCNRNWVADVVSVESRCSRYACFQLNSRTNEKRDETNDV